MSSVGVAVISVPYLGGACGEGVDGCDDWKEAGTLGVATGVSLNPRGRCPPNPTACTSGVSPGVSGLSSTSFCYSLITICLGNVKMYVQPQPQEFPECSA